MRFLKKQLLSRKKEMIELLTDAEERVGRSPSLRQFDSLDFETSAYAIEEIFGTWNDAKREAGLETYEPGEGRYVTTAINEEYFEKIDNSEKAYWFGTLIGASNIRENELMIARREKPFFVKKFSEAIESDYAISEFNVTENGNEYTRHSTNISNPTFVDHLKSAGHPAGDDNSTETPEIPNRFRAPFTRGYLESSGYFSTGGWRVRVDAEESAERLQSWFESFGAKRPTIGEVDGDPLVGVANEFDMRSVFETCWPDGVSTEPSYRPYPEKIIEHLNSEYPYPENVDYLED